MIFRVWALFLAIMVLFGCSGMKPQDFAHQTPRFVLEEYFRGRTQASGIFEDWSGDVRRQFVVDIDGTWDGKTLTLDERFHFADGEEQRRVWQITKVSEHAYEGRADDVVGKALGASFGNALNWRYAMDLKVGERTWRVQFNDWMFLQPDGIVINRARVLKFGVTVGEVTLAFHRPSAASAGAGAQVVAASAP
jgi:hypothetical protein